MIMKMYMVYNNSNSGYIAGAQDGIVTVNNIAASRRVDVLDVRFYKVIATCISMQTGHYLIPHLDPDKEYLVIARDYKKEYEPLAYDYVKPATDLTPAEQQDLWRSWQEK